MIPGERTLLSGWDFGIRGTGRDFLADVPAACADWAWRVPGRVGPRPVIVPLSASSPRRRFDTPGSRFSHSSMSSGSRARGGGKLDFCQSLITVHTRRMTALLPIAASLSSRIYAEVTSYGFLIGAHKSFFGNVGLDERGIIVIRQK